MFKQDVLRIPAFRNLWLGQAISQLGDAFYFVVFMFAVKKLTGSNAMVGYVGAMDTLPYLLGGFYAGVVADRLDRRKIMFLSDIVCGGILIVFAAVTLLAGRPPLWLMLVTPLTLSCFRTFFLPAKSASIPSLVPGDKLLQANGISSTTQTVMPLISLGISATIMMVLYSQLGTTWFLTGAVIVNSLSFFGSAIFISKLPQLKPDRDHADQTHPLADMKEGLRYIKRRHELVVLMVLGFLMNLFISPFFVVYVAANDAWFGGKPQFLTWCEFSFFAGMVLSSAYISKLDLRRPGIGYVWGLGITGLMVALMAFSRSMTLFVIWNLIAGLAMPFGQIPMLSYLQSSVPDAFRGRVLAVQQTLAMGVMPVGQALGGILVEEIGLVNGFLAMGLGMGCIALFGLLDKPFRTMSLAAPNAAGRR